MEILGEFIIYLLCAAIAVPIFSKLGFGSVLGYLTAGVVVGPYGLGLIGEVEAKLHFAELGVVLLLFIIGLELQPSRLWVLRRSIFGLGSAQVVLSAALICGAAVLFGFSLKGALVLGLVLSLSSTAFVLQMLAEKKQLATRHGRAAFATLLFQDLAVIPMLALIPLLGDPAAAGPTSTENPFIAALEIILVIVAFILAGRYLLRPLLRLVVPFGAEVSTAVALLLVLSSAALMEHLGLSMELGAFLAGVLLADSEYRHELEASIEPFKGLLLGLFFLAVGMSIEVTQLLESPMQLLGITLLLMALKIAVLYPLGRVYGLDASASRSYAATLAQGGEFAFVLLGVAISVQALTANQGDTVVVAVTLSMVLTPFFFIAVEAINRRLAGTREPRPYDEMKDDANAVIIAGFGRFGQIAARVLQSRGIGFTALESSAAQVDFVRKFGNKVYYGDPSRLDLLRAAGADKARIMLIAVDNVEASMKTAELVKRQFPHLKILARAHDRHHAYLLMDLGIEHVYRETLGSSLELTQSLLCELGDSPERAGDTVRRFRDHDEKTLRKQQVIHRDETRLVETARESAEELRRLFESDPEDL